MCNLHRNVLSCIVKEIKEHYLLALKYNYLFNLEKDAHRATINHLSCSGDGQTLLTGASDGVTLLTTLATGKVSKLRLARSS